MTDVHDVATRSRNMAAIKNKHTQPEIWLRKQLHAAGFRYRLNVAALPGKPDLVLAKYRAVIFVQGCFWHQHNCAQFHWPKSRVDWWRAKITATRRHDEMVQDKLREMGWRVLLLWQCAIKGRTRLPQEQLLAQINDWIRYGGSFAELPPADTV